MDRKNSKDLKVVELFAGVGGFRLGLRETRGYKIIWANQWEPATTKQHAAKIYAMRFHDGKEPNKFFNEDINKVVDMPNLPIPKHDILVGGFPCQDYSVARTLSHATGIKGKKGVLWWAIHKILERQRVNAPKYLMLENVDRLLKSPAKQRGRDFAIILASLSDLGYAVEWRVVNAGEYGMPQRRRRTFMLAYKRGSPIYKKLSMRESDEAWLLEEGVAAKAFPITRELMTLPLKVELKGSLADISDKFQYEFQNAGLMVGRKFTSIRTKPIYTGKRETLRDALLSEDKVPEEYFIPQEALERWAYLKGAKNEPRKTKDGFIYHYKEGPIAFPDALDKPSRTIITGEGGPTPARHKHVVLTSSGRYRRLTPLELERLCMFPPNHTELTGIGDQRRAFFMGNALVVGVIKKFGQALLAAHTNG